MGSPPADVGGRCNDAKSPTNCIHQRWITMGDKCTCTARCKQVHAAKGQACGKTSFVCHTVLHAGAPMDLCIDESWGLCVDDKQSELPPESPPKSPS